MPHRCSPTKNAVRRARSSPPKKRVKNNNQLRFTDLELLSACASGSIDHVYSLAENGLDDIPMPLLMRCIAMARKHDHVNLVKVLRMNEILRKNSAYEVRENRYFK
jgi:hypothetical protein